MGHRSFPPVRSVLVALTLATRHDGIVAAGAAFARRWGARVTLLQLLDPAAPDALDARAVTAVLGLPRRPTALRRLPPRAPAPPEPYLELPAAVRTCERYGQTPLVDVVRGRWRSVLTTHPVRLSAQVVCLNPPPDPEEAADLLCQLLPTTVLVAPATAIA